MALITFEMEVQFVTIYQGLKIMAVQNYSHKAIKLDKFSSLVKSKMHLRKQVKQTGFKGRLVPSRQAGMKGPHEENQYTSYFL